MPNVQVYMYKFVVWLFWKFVSKFIFIHVDLHVGFPARAAQANSFSATRTPRVWVLARTQGSLFKNYLFDVKVSSIWLDALPIKLIKRLCWIDLLQVIHFKLKKVVYCIQLLWVWFLKTNQIQIVPNFYIQHQKFSGHLEDIQLVSVCIRFYHTHTDFPIYFGFLLDQMIC